MDWTHTECVQTWAGIVWRTGDRHTWTWGAGAGRSCIRCRYRRQRHSRKICTAGTEESDTGCVTWVLGTGGDSHVGWHGLQEQRENTHIPPTPPTPLPTTTITLYCHVPEAWANLPCEHTPHLSPWARLMNWNLLCLGDMSSPKICYSPSFVDIGNLTCQIAPKPEWLVLRIV